MPLGQGAVPRTHNTLSRCSVVPHTDTSTRCALQTQPVLSTLPTVGRYARSSSDKCAGFCHHHHRRPPGHIFSVSRSLLLQMGISPAVLFVKLFQLNKLPTGSILVHFGALTSHESRRKHFSPTRPCKHQEHPKLNCKMRGHVGIYKCKEHNAR